MENINQVFDRTTIENEIKDILCNFEDKCNDLLFKKGIYLYGSPGA